MLNTTLRKQLNELKLTNFVELLDTNYELYLKQGLSFSEILSLLSDAEIQNRHQRRIERLIKAAKFRYPSARLQNPLPHIHPISSNVTAKWQIT